MALIKCPDCGHDVSDKAECCINCGRPLMDSKMRYRVDREQISKYTIYAYCIGLFLTCISLFLPYNYNRFGYDNMFSLGTGMAGRSIIIFLISVICLVSELFIMVKGIYFKSPFETVETIIRFILLIVSTAIIFSYDVALRSIIYFESLNKNAPELFPPEKSFGFYTLIISLIICYASIILNIVEKINNLRKK